MNNNQRSAIKALQKLATRWPEGIALFAFSGSLCVVSSDREVIEWIDGIPADGGDPGTYRKAGREYLGEE